MRYIPAYLLLYELKRLFFKDKYIAEVDATWRCQLHCSHCYYNNIGNKNEKDSSEWIVFFKTLYGKGVRYVLLVGGEPTLRMDVIQQAIKTFRYVDIITNGQIKIPQEYTCRIFLSIDGNEDINDKIRGINSFKNAVSNYEGDKRVIINFTLRPDNYSDLESAILLANQNNFKGVVCNIITPNRTPDENTDIIKKEERCKIISELKRVKTIYPGKLFFTRQMIHWYEKPDHTDYCYWRSNVLHFDYQFNTKYCFSDLDCRFCGCYAGASLSCKIPF
ncbi:MAG TPA: hypothetical protein PKW80_08505 [Bacteroidales bacterium]|nr:hypothetical protein [Bacteroidales bacterium]